MTKPDRRNRRSGPSAARRKPPRADRLWLWGSHAVAAASANPERTIIRLVATENAARRMALSDVEMTDAKTLDRLLPQGAVHQGVAAEVRPLPETPLEDIIAARPACVAVLDQISDPHNYGAVLRSAAAFGVAAVIGQTRHAPPITGIVAKSAAGAVETVADVRVVNIARTLEALAEAGYQVVGLDGATEAVLADTLEGDQPIAIVLGAEGTGLRPAVAKACTTLARIPMTPDMESLNISNAAAIAFYEAYRMRRD